MKMNRCVLLMICVVCVSLFFIDDHVLAAEIILNMGASSTPEHSRYKAAEIFVKEVKEASNGAIESRMHFGGVLGNETQMARSVQAGTLEVGWISDIGLSTVVPAIGFVNLPYLFPNYESVDKYYFNGWLGEIVKVKLEQNGFKFLAFLENDFRWLTNNKRPILKPEDIVGLKIRTVETPMFIKFFKELGALPTPMGITEVGTALQQGIIDGQDNGAILTYAYGFYSFQKHLTKTNHSYSGGAIVISKKTWESLTPNQQRIIEDAAIKAGKWQIKRNREDVNRYVDLMKQEGMEIHDITPELDVKFREVADKVWDDPYNEKLYGKDIMQRMKSEFSVK